MVLSIWRIRTRRHRHYWSLLLWLFVALSSNLLPSWAALWAATISYRGIIYYVLEGLLLLFAIKYGNSNYLPSFGQCSSDFSKRSPFFPVFTASAPLCASASTFSLLHAVRVRSRVPHLSSRIRSCTLHALDANFSQSLNLSLQLFKVGDTSETTAQTDYPGLLRGCLLTAASRELRRELLRFSRVFWMPSGITLEKEKKKMELVDRCR